jgi:AcrR family transcriptional regulator
MALLRAAEHAFAERGVAAVQVDDIAESAGLSKAAFFLHFESKEAALKQIVEQWVERCTSLYAAPGEYPEALTDPEVLIDFCIEREIRFYEFLWQSRATMRIIHTCHAEYGYLLDSFRGEMGRRNREWLTMWRQDGLLRPETNVELASVLMSGAYEELAQTMVRSETRPPFEHWLEFTQDTFLRAWGSAELVAAVERRSGRARSSRRRFA